MLAGQANHFVNNTDQRSDALAAAWWKDAVVYQIYVPSFADHNGDGLGDLAGITSRLDYLNDGTARSLGVDAIWLTPFYPSPFADLGYDVADYTDVDPRFGSLADFDILLVEAHRRGMRVIIDWVPNHTSDQHPWFVESRSARTSAKRNWYVWRDGEGESTPPNNWQSTFDGVGPAWTYDPLTEQWYLHSFSPHQPDLNWDEPAVEAALHDVVRFWFERGVDGLRIDVAHKIGKDPDLADNPAAIVKPDAAYTGLRHDEDWPSVHERLRGVRRLADTYGDRVLVGEVYILGQARVAEYVNGGDGLHMAHNFALMHVPWDAEAFRRVIAEFEGYLAAPAWPAWFLNNHDHSRVVSRFDHDGAGSRRARLLAMLLLTLRGTPFLYQGEELGLRDVRIPSEAVVDVDGRDPVRSPVPWAPPSSAGDAAGFSEGRPWLPLTPDAEELNVARQLVDPNSTLSLYRRLIWHRRLSATLRRGRFRALPTEGTLAFLREGEDRLLVVLNFADRAIEFRAPDPGADTGLLEMSTDATRSDPRVVDTRRMQLQPLEGVIIRLEQRHD